MKEHLIFAALSPFMVVVIVCAGIGVLITFMFLLIGERVSRESGECPG